MEPSLLFAWFAVRVKPHFERLSARLLRAKGYEEFLPEYLTRHKWVDREKPMSTPLFPGYLFCRLDPSARLPVLTTPGVIEIVGAGRVPVEVPEQQIEAVRRMVTSGLPIQPWTVLEAGNRVEIVRGPLAGLEGTLVFVKGYRLVVSVPLLRRSVAAEVDVDSVRVVRSKAATATFPGRVSMGCACANSRRGFSSRR